MKLSSELQSLMIMMMTTMRRLGNRCFERSIVETREQSFSLEAFSDMVDGARILAEVFNRSS